MTEGNTGVWLSVEEDGAHCISLDVSGFGLLTSKLYRAGSNHESCDSFLGVRAASNYEGGYDKMCVRERREPDPRHKCHFHEK